MPSALRTIQAEFTTVTDFERDFPSLCFALATGVGKTRLMGAFITYLFRRRLSRHFFVLAPNLTIYNKLITDFTPNTSKYVFEGIAEFATNPPELITGDNYESGRGVRSEEAVQSANCSTPARSTSTSSTSPKSTAKFVATEPPESSASANTSGKATSIIWQAR